MPVIHTLDHDVELTLGPSCNVEYQRPNADVIAEFFFEGWARYTFCQDGDGYVARFHGLSDFDISSDLRRVRCRPDPRLDLDVVPILFCGGIVAFILMAAGRAVLHASAVEVQGNAVAFAGPSRCGKSTLAALLCASGAGLVTDDNLPLSIEGDEIRCDGGAVELRLRPSAAQLVERFPTAPRTRRTVDERLAVSPLLRQSPKPSLATIFLPLPVYDSSKLEVAPVPRPEAALRLAECFRITGWRARDDLRRTFRLATEVAERVPVLEMRVPWALPFSDDLPAQIVAAAGLGERRLAEAERS